MNPGISGAAIAFVLLISSFLGSCTTLRRYSSVESPGRDDSLAGINIFSSRLMPADQDITGKNLWDLSADAQSQFIKILNTRYPDNRMFLSSLNNVYLTGDEQVPAGDYINKNLRLVFSVSRKRDFTNVPGSGLRLSPADRLEYLKISLTLKDTSLKFTGWNKYSTEYGSIDIGDVSFSRSLDLSSALALTGSKDRSDLSLEGKASLTRDEKQPVGYRYIRLNGRLSDRVIEMEEEGARDIDLTGNIIADVSLEFEGTGEMVTIIYGLKDSTGSFNNPGRLSLESHMAMVPDIKKIKEVIEADLTMYFIYRNVKKGMRTYPEWDDRVKYYEGRVIKPVVLFRENDYVPGFCIIGKAGDEPGEFLTVKMPAGESYPLIFRTYGEATVFREWLAWFMVTAGGGPLKISGCLLQFRGKDLTPDLMLSDSGLAVFPYYR